MLYTQKQLDTQTPFNNYFKAKDLPFIRKLIPQLMSLIPYKIREKYKIPCGGSNCTLNATNAYGDEYTRGSAKTIVKGDPMFEEITDSKDIIPGVMMIQSEPNKSDEEATYHSTIFSGIADSSYVNQFGDTIQVGDSLYRYSNGDNYVGAFRERPKQALLQNHGKTKIRYYRPRKKD